MNTVATDAAAELSRQGYLSTWKRWLSSRRAGPALLCPGARRGSDRIPAQARARAGAGRRCALSAVRAGGFGCRRTGRARTRTDGNRSRRGAWLLRRYGFSHRLDDGSRQCRHICAHRSGHLLERRAAATHSRPSRGQHARDARPRGASHIDSRYRAGRDDRHRRTRHHSILQLRGRAAVRLHRAGGARNEHQALDAIAVPGESRWLPRAISSHRRKTHHRHRPCRRRRAQGWLDLPDGARGRRDAVEQPAVLYRLHPRPDGAAANGGKASGIAVRTRPYFALDRHGRDGVRAGA